MLVGERMTTCLESLGQPRYPAGPFGVRPRWAWVCALGVLALAGCATPGPQAVARQYAQALRDNRLDDAYALTRATSGTGPVDASERQAFYRLFSGEAERLAAADRAEQGAAKLRAEADGLELRLESGRWRVVPVIPESPRAVLERFITAVDKGDFAGAYSLLSGAWRARYTPQRFEADFRSETGASARLARARAALALPPRVEGSSAEFPLGEGRAVRLRREDGSYRVDSLE